MPALVLLLKPYSLPSCCLPGRALLPVLSDSQSVRPFSLQNALRCHGLPPKIRCRLCHPWIWTGEIHKTMRAVRMSYVRKTGRTSAVWIWALPESLLIVFHHPVWIPSESHASSQTESSSADTMPFLWSQMLHENTSLLPLSHPDIIQEKFRFLLYAHWSRWTVLHTHSCSYQ